MVATTYSLPGGVQISLGGELGRGGEGSVFEVNGRPTEVAKVYHKAPGTELAGKLAAMCANGTAGMSKLAAWPTNLVQERGRTVGFLMPKVSGYRPAFELYGPKLRLQKFPKADWRFLIHASTNTARAFAAVHGAGQVIGDVNHGNLVIGQDATVRLIDCDSFQITNASRTWFCEVGVPTHQPPEMQGLSSYAGFRRTSNHDSFGLAVLIFQMLCMARHPYSGRWQGSGDQPSIEEAIRAFRYAYSSDQRTTRTIPPPGSLPMEALGPQIRQMFEQAFLAGGAQTAGRPIAANWIASLEGLAGSLKQCSVSAGHYHLASLRACPWCAIESGGVPLFPVIFVKGASGVDGFMLLWQQVSTISVPGSRAPMPDSPLSAPTEDARAAGRRKAAGLTAGIAVCTAAFLAMRFLIKADVSVPLLPLLLMALFGFMVALNLMSGAIFKEELTARKKEWASLTSDWLNTATADRPRSVRDSMDRLKVAYDTAVADRSAKLLVLQADRRASQLATYLDRFRIAGAGIRGVGDGKAAILQSYGIETAADVVEWRILAISGFGPKTVESMVTWRRSKEAMFRFDASKPISPLELGPVENAFAQKRRELELKLTAGLAELRRAVATEASIRTDLLDRHRRLAPGYGQAIANARAALWHA